MTLVFSVFTNEYALLTSDSAIRYSNRNLKTGEETDIINTVLETKGFKVTQITEKVIYGMAGIKEFHEIILEKLLMRVRQDDDLHKVASIYKEVCAEVAKTDDLYKFLMDKKLISGGFLTGYYRNGKIGRVEIKAEGDIQMKKIYNPSFGVLAPPGFEGDIHGGIFHIDRENDSLEAVVQRLQQLHAMFSLVIPDHISPDCTFYLLRKSGKKIELKKVLVDTSTYYDILPSKEEIREVLFTGKN